MGWILNGFQQVFTLQNMLISLLGCFLGNLVGVLPGLGPTASVSLLFPFMLKLPPLSILLCLGAVYYGAMYGGSITSVLLNIPGEVASVPTAMDGYPLAKQGRAGSTLLICAMSSFFGSLLALFLVAFFAPALGKFALSFGPFEYFGLMFFSLAVLPVFRKVRYKVCSWLFRNTSFHGRLRFTDQCFQAYIRFFQITTGF